MASYLASSNSFKVTLTLLKMPVVLYIIIENRNNNIIPYGCYHLYILSWSWVGALCRVGAAGPTLFSAPSQKIFLFLHSLRLGINVLPIILAPNSWQPSFNTAKSKGQDVFYQQEFFTLLPLWFIFHFTWSNIQEVGFL